MSKSLLKMAMAGATLLLCGQTANAYWHYANVYATANPSDKALVVVSTTNTTPQNITFSSYSDGGKQATINNSSAAPKGSVYIYTMVTDTRYQFSGLTKTSANEKYDIGATEYYDNNKYSKTEVKVTSQGGLVYSTYKFDCNFTKVWSDYGVNATANCLVDGAKTDGVGKVYIAESAEDVNDSKFASTGTTYSYNWRAAVSATNEKNLYLYAKVTNDYYEFTGWNDGTSTVSTDPTKVAVSVFGAEDTPSSYNFNALFTKAYTDYKADVQVLAAPQDPENNPGNGLLVYATTVENDNPDASLFQAAGSTFNLTWKARIGETSKTVYIYSKLASSDYAFVDGTDETVVSDDIRKTVLTVNGQEGTAATYESAHTFTYYPKTTEYYASIQLGSKGNEEDDVVMVYVTLDENEEPAQDSYKEAGTVFTLHWTAETGVKEKKAYIHTYAPSGYVFNEWSVTDQPKSAAARGGSGQTTGVSQKMEITLQGDLEGKQTTYGYTAEYTGVYTGIDGIDAEKIGKDGEWFTLSGIRVDRPQKGQIYIRNNRKVAL